jgi:hypothetical protein
VTAKELIDVLKNLNSSTLVLVEGYEGGLSDIYETKTLKVNLNVNSEHYYGRHEDSRDGNVSALILMREHRVE